MFISVIYSGFVKRYSEYCTMYETLFGYGKSVGLNISVVWKVNWKFSVLRVVNARQG